MNHTKIALIAILFIVGAYSSCQNNPLKPADFGPDDWSDTVEGVDVPAELKFCKAVTGKICLTEAGLEKAKKAFDDKKAAFIAARTAHLEKWNAMETDFAAVLPDMANMVADLGAEVNSTMRLMARLYVNMVNQWDCKFREADDPANGAKKGDLNLDDCPGRENETEWAMNYDYKSIKKTVMKKIINIALAGYSMMPTDNPTPQRFLAQDYYDFNNMEDLNKFMELNEKEVYMYLKDHMDQIQEVNFAEARIAVRKYVKPLLTLKIAELMEIKKNTFDAQKTCFKHLFLAEASLKCMAISAVSKVKTVGDKKKVYVKKAAMTTIKNACFDFVEENMELGNAWDEAQGLIFQTTEYPKQKTLWIAYKRMLSKLSKSEMKYQQILDIVLEGIFDTDGLYDESMKYYTSMYTAIIARMKEVKVWEMNFNMPEGCTKTACPHINDWFTAKGVSDHARNLKNFRGDGEEETLAEFSEQLMVIEHFKTAFKWFTPQADEVAEKIYASENEQAAVMILMEAFNMTVPTPPAPTRRMLAEGDVELAECVEGDADFENAVEVGADDQCDDTEADFEAVDTTDSAGISDAVANLSEEDVGPNYGDSDVNDIDGDSSSEGWSFMTWLMVIFGALFVLTLVGGAVHVCMNRKDADQFEHDTEMHGTHH